MSENSRLGSHERVDERTERKEADADTSYQNRAASWSRRTENAAEMSMVIIRASDMPLYFLGCRLGTSEKTRWSSKYLSRSSAWCHSAFIVSVSMLMLAG